MKNTKQPCPDCGGYGRIGNALANAICSTCKGTGEARYEPRECFGCKNLLHPKFDAAGGGSYKCLKYHGIVGSRGHWTNETDVPREIEKGCYEPREIESGEIENGI